MKCISWSSRSASTRTVEEPPLACGLAAGAGLRRRGGGAARGRGAAVGRAAGRRRDVLDLVGLVERGVGDGLEDDHVGDLGHRAGGVGELGVGVLGDDPRVDLAAVEGVDVVRRRGGRRASRRARRATTAPCRRARTASTTSSLRIAVTWTTRRPSASSARSSGAGAAPARWASCSACARARAPCRRSISACGSISSCAGLVDRLDGGRQRVEAVEEHVDGGALEPAAGAGAAARRRPPSRA